MDFYHEWMDPTSLTRLVVTSSSVRRNADSKSIFGKGKKMTERLFTLLSISTRLLFDNVRELVLAAFDEPGALSSFSPTERIVLARKYDVERWLKPAYVDLCQRSQNLGTEDVQALGLETVLLMAGVRERYLYGKGHIDGINKRWGAVGSESDLKKLAETAVVETFFTNLDPATQPAETSDAS